MPEKREYTVCFLFDSDLQNVLLVKKGRTGLHGRFRVHAHAVQGLLIGPATQVVDHGEGGPCGHDGRDVANHDVGAVLRRVQFVLNGPFPAVLSLEVPLELFVFHGPVLRQNVRTALRFLARGLQVQGRAEEGRPGAQNDATG